MGRLVQHIPNLLTGSRFFFLAGFLWLLFAVERGELATPAGVVRQAVKLDWAFVLFVTGQVTDMLDGLLARRLHACSRFGRWFDPLVDKITIGGGFAALAWFGLPLSGIAWWMAAVILLREGLVTLLRHLSEARGRMFTATWAGKVKLFLQSFTIGTVLIYMGHHQGKVWAIVFRDMTIWITLVFTLISTAIYVPRLKWLYREG